MGTVLLALRPLTYLVLTSILIDGVKSTLQRNRRVCELIFFHVSALMPMIGTSHSRKSAQCLAASERPLQQEEMEDHPPSLRVTCG